MPALSGYTIIIKGKLVSYDQLASSLAQHWLTSVFTPDLAEDVPKPIASIVTNLHAET